MYTADQLQTFTAKLTAGEVAAAPAEGVYGYCCDPFNPAALNKLVALKQRKPEKGFVVLVSALKQLEQLTQPLACQQHDMIDLHWPGQVTLVFPAAENLPELLTGGFSSVAIRFPKEPYMLEYLKAWGKPLVSTSANISGQPPVYEAQNLPSQIFALPAPAKLNGSVSTLLDATTGQQYR